MGKKTDTTIILDGQEITGISESELQINYEQNTIERECEIATIYGNIKFTAVFTREQWAEFVEISKTTERGTK